MKYIDGIKTIKYISFKEAIMRSNGRIGLLDCGMKICMVATHEPTHIPITYYKPIIVLDEYEYISDTFVNPLNIKWIDGQPYELVVL